MLWSKLRYRVELAKKQLSESAEVEVPVPDPDRSAWHPVATVSVDRGTFAAVNRDLVERFQAPVWRALQ